MLLRAQAHHAGLLVPNAVFGLAWSGQFTTTRLLRLLRHLPSGVVEIYTHPATIDRFSGSALGYRYSEELEALCAPRCWRRFGELRSSQSAIPALFRARWENDPVGPVLVFTPKVRAITLGTNINIQNWSSRIGERTTQ